MAGLPVVRAAHDPLAAPERLVLLGASNVVRGLHVALDTARRAWGAQLEVMGAIGLGRSYGGRSSVLARALPGIVESGLWEELERRPRLPTRALVTDVGNDILYNAPVDDILRWVETCVLRLRAQGAGVVLTGLPVARSERVSPAGYALLRAAVFPRYGWLPRADAVSRVRAVNAGLQEIAARTGARFVAPQESWYGLDPIHIRVGAWRTAWPALLAAGEPLVGRRTLGAVSAVRLAAARPDRQWLFGAEQRRAQPVLTLRGGTSLSLY